MKYIIFLLLIIGSVIVAADTIDLEGEHLNNTNKEEYKHTYQPYEETTTFYDNTVNKVYYSTLHFADSKGTLLKDTYSLMNCEFCSEIRLEIETDKDFPIKVIDFNLTSIKIVPQLTEKNLDINIPLKVNNIKSKTVNQSLLVTGNKEGDTVEVKLPFGFDKEIKYGFNSTTIKINISYGVLDFYYYDTTLTDYGGFFIKFNTTALPLNSILIDATLNLELISTATAYTNITIWSIDNETWVNSSISNQLANNLTRLRTYPQNYSFTPTTGEYKRFNVTNQTRPYTVNGNVTYNIEGAEFYTQYVKSIFRGASDAYMQSPGVTTEFNNAENIDGTGFTPYLNITYIPGLNVSIGVFNNTYYNYTDGVIYSNSTAGNGSYTSTVFALNGAYNQLNITASTESQPGYEVQGSVRTWNTLNFSKDLRVFMPFIEAGQTTTRDKSGDWYNNSCTAQNQANIYLDVNNLFPISKYDGTNDWYSCNYLDLNMTVGQNITLCAYIQTQNSNTEQAITFIPGGAGGQILLAKIQNGKLAMQVHGNSGTSTNAVILNNTYQHICGVFKNDDNAYLMYINGTSVAVTGGNGDDLNANATRFNIGTRDNGNNLDWNGNITMLRIWYSLLSAGDIANVYQQDVLNTSWQTYQSFPTGIATNNYSITNTSTFAQAKFKMYDNSTYATKLYGFNWTGWNFYGEAEEPTGVCACGTPASCITQWTWNMSCSCNITTPYYCPATYINMDTSIGIWYVNTTVAGRFDFANGSSNQKILGNRSGWLNTS